MQLSWSYFSGFAIICIWFFQNRYWTMTSQDLPCSCHPASLAWPLPWYDHHKVPSWWPWLWWPQLWWQSINVYDGHNHGSGDDTMRPFKYQWSKSLKYCCRGDEGEACPTCGGAVFEAEKVIHDNDENDVDKDDDYDDDDADMLWGCFWGGKDHSSIIFLHEVNIWKIQNCQMLQRFKWSDAIVHWKCYTTFYSVFMKDIYFLQVGQQKVLLTKTWSLLQKRIVQKFLLQR